MKKYANTFIFNKQFPIPMKQEETFASLSAAGFNEIEIRREYIKDNGSELPVIAELAKRQGLTLYYAIVDTFYKDGSLNKNALDIYFSEAATLGAKTVKLMPGDFVALSSEDAEYLRSKTQSGLELMLENGQKTTPAQMKDFVTACEAAGIELGITFDLGNWVWGGWDVPATAELLKPWAKAVHLKDGAEKDGQLQVVPIGEGVTDWKKVVRILSDCRFAIEYSCGDAAIENMLKELDKLDFLDC